MRAIWLVWCMVLHPERLTCMEDIVTWGEGATGARTDGQRLVRLGDLINNGFPDHRQRRTLPLQTFVRVRLLVCSCDTHATVRCQFWHGFGLSWSHHRHDRALLLPCPTPQRRAVTARRAGVGMLTVTVLPELTGTECFTRAGRRCGRGAPRGFGDAPRWTDALVGSPSISDAFSSFFGSGEAKLQGLFFMVRARGAGRVSA